MLKHDVRAAYIRWLLIDHLAGDTDLATIGGFEPTDEP